MLQELLTTPQQQQQQQQQHITYDANGKTNKQHILTTVSIIGTQIYTPYPYSICSDTRVKRKAFITIFKQLLTQLKLNQ